MLIASALVSSFGNCNLEGTARETLMIILSLDAHAFDHTISSYDTVALFDPFALYLLSNTSKPLLGSELRDMTSLSRKKLDYVGIDALCNYAVTALKTLH